MPAAHSGPAENLFVSAITNLDALNAATTLVHRMTVVTRNGSDFASTGVPLLNPWDSVNKPGGLQRTKDPGLTFTGRDMQTTTLSSKGQVIIPKALRTARQWGPGTRLEVHDTPEGVLLRPVAQRRKMPLAEGLATLRRRLAYSGPAITIEEMNAEALRQATSRLAPRRDAVSLLEA
jgi:AbrB family looped-hinge helix DNA binding protein